MISLVHHPEGGNRLGELLIKNFAEPKWKHFRAAVAFVKNSGVKFIKDPLAGFLAWGTAKISVGVDHAGTSLEGVTELLAALGSKGEAWIVHNEQQVTFHPKIYLFSNDTHAECFIGSGNLTKGGLFENYEAFVQLMLDKADASDLVMLRNIEALLDSWADTAQGTVLKLTPELVTELASSGYLPTEAQIRDACEEVEAKVKRTSPKRKKLFASIAPKRAPKLSIGSRKTAVPTASAPAAGVSGFLMTLQETDVGKGQKTKGTSARSPEIFIPIGAVRANPNFWGWPRGQVPVRPHQLLAILPHEHEIPARLKSHLGTNKISLPNSTYHRFQKSVCARSHRSYAHGCGSR